MYASKYGHTDIVKALLTVPDIDVNMKDMVKKNYDCMIDIV